MQKRARQLKATLLNVADGSRIGSETEGMRLLRNICSSLGAEGSVKRLLDALEAEGSEISTYEFLSSGCVKQLKSYLIGMPPSTGPLCGAWYLSKTPQCQLAAQCLTCL